MRVTRVSVTNVMGIEELEINEPGALTVVEALNGQGKTSLIAAITSITEGGHDPTLLRAGADSGKVYILLDDGTEITKEITREKSDLTVRRPDIGRVGAGQTLVNRLFRAMSVNPIAFLQLPEKQQAQALLEALPLELDRSKVEQAINDLVPLTDADFRGHALLVLSALRDRLYDERTGVNRIGKEKRATIEQLSASLPDDDEGDPSEELERLETADAAAEQELAKARLLVTDRADEQVRMVTAELDAEIQAATERLQRLTEGRLSIIAEIDDQVDAQLAELDAQERVRVAETAERKKALRDRIKSRGATENTRQFVAQAKVDMEQALQRSQALTRAMAELDALKLSTARELPIKGLEIREGILYKGDVPFRRLNKAEQVKTAMRFAAKMASEVPLICLDGIETLDAPTFEAFCEAAAEMNLQFVVTRVAQEDGPTGLHITTAGGIPAEV